ncbi:MAG TPA: biopolymer transporter ExbD [Steroidobacteraceae bacterium]|nr:biopolymer transporter ExbD [Steroidobacteraceae bacterium]
MSEINTTPLVDVMLVLLIIFLITIPVIKNSVPLELPKAVAPLQTRTKPEDITIAVDAKGNIYWGLTRVDSTSDLVDRVASVAVKVPQPEIHVRGDVNALYKDIGRVIYAVQKGGIIKMNFTTEPDRALPPER